MQANKPVSESLGKVNGQLHVCKKEDNIIHVLVSSTSALYFMFLFMDIDIQPKKKRNIDKIET